MNNKQSVLTELGVREKRWRQSFLEACQFAIQDPSDLADFRLEFDYEALLGISLENLFLLELPDSFQFTDYGGNKSSIVSKTRFREDRYGRPDWKLENARAQTLGEIQEPELSRSTPTSFTENDSSLKKRENRQRPEEQKFFDQRPSFQLDAQETSVFTQQKESGKPDQDWQKREMPDHMHAPEEPLDTQAARKNEASSTQKTVKEDKENMEESFFSFGNLNDLTERLRSENQKKDKNAPSGSREKEFLPRQLLDEEHSIFFEDTRSRSFEQEDLKTDREVRKGLESLKVENDHAVAADSIDTDAILEALSEKLFREYQRYYGG